MGKGTPTTQEAIHGRRDYNVMKQSFSLSEINRAMKELNQGRYVSAGIYRIIQRIYEKREDYVMASKFRDRIQRIWDK